MTKSEEISDSNSSSSSILDFPLNHPSASASASRFKGVVSQPNGHWGAQIYANHQRIWLGTFKSEKEAATAYDSASIKLRNGQHSHRNFPWTEATIHEPHFQSQFPTEIVLAMIKDGSYSPKFSDFLRAVQDRQGYPLATMNFTPPGIKLRQLFQKELTPSDVSKLNRLVIPKKYAVKFFPQISDVENSGGSMDDVELVFFDRAMRSWKFRYCYWKSSQSFVFTRGWNGFAKEKRLRPRDRVIFSSYQAGNEHQKVCIIDVAYNDGGATTVEGGGDRREVALQTRIDPPVFDNYDHGRGFEKNMDESEEEEEESGYGEVEEKVPTILVAGEEKKGFKLFGVQII